MTNRAFPADPSGLSPGWFSERLHASGHSGRTAEVTGFTTEPIGVGIGVLSLLWRVFLTYSQPGAGPSTIVLKLPHTGTQSREICDAFRFYLREVRAYEEIGARTPLAMPACYHAAFDDETGDFVLVLEDLGDRRMVDQWSGCGADDADVAIAALAGHHAALWNDDSLPGRPWVFRPIDPPNPQALVPALKRSWPIIEAEFLDLLPGALAGVAERFPDSVERLLAAMSEPPMTLLHGDYRLDNLYFAAADHHPPVVAGDWQITGLGRGPCDVAYFLSQSLRPEVRRSEEERLLRRYHDALSAAGVTDYGWSTCWDDYRRYTFFCLAYPLNAGAVNLVDDRAVALFRSMLERAVTAVMDLDAAEFLSG